MKYVGIAREQLMHFIPAIIKYAEDLDLRILGHGAEISIRGTDHGYDSIRFEPLGENYNLCKSVRQQLYEYANTHCCLCGSTDDVVVENPDDSLASTFCSYCRAKRKSMVDILMYELEHLNKSFFHGIPRIKTKLCTSDGYIIYKFADELRIEQNKLKLLQQNGKGLEDVELIGLDTGLRDKNNERVFEGDVLYAVMPDGRHYYGMVRRINENPLGGHTFIHSEMDKYVLVHGWGNLPSTLADADSFEIIGTVGSVKDFVGPYLSDEKYEIWCLENKTLLESIDDRLRTMR